jgi:hypothetical protein
MPISKVRIDSHDMCVVYEETTVTHWAQMISSPGGSPVIIRCDDRAYETGFGTWAKLGPGTHSHIWTGLAQAFGCQINPENWLVDDHTIISIVEKDYS